MKSMIAVLFSLSALGAAQAQAADETAIRVTPPTAQKSFAGAAANFTGSVMVSGLFRGDAPARVSGGLVAFEPGARTAWHTHPLGQTLIVTDGVGQVQEWDGSIREIRKGDIVWIPPGVKHWHGASPKIAMTHIAIAEALDGKSVDWMEQVDGK
jgi:quercetin dioxygenase-like cupin family protein